MSSLNQATERLYQLIRRQGHDFLKLPSSVKVYLNQELAEFPEEKAVLIASIDAGVLDQVQSPPQDDNKAAFYKLVANRFSKNMGVHPEWAKWAVNLWVDVLADLPKASLPKPIQVGKTVREMNAEIHNHENNDPQLEILRGGSPIWLKLFMTLIVVIGGFTGAFIGRSWPVAAIVLGWDVVDMTMGKSEFEKAFPTSQRKLSGIQKAFAYCLFFIIFSTPTAMSGALGSMAGWWFGRADGRPWLGFGACFAAACGTNTIMVMLTGCIPSLIVTFFVCFAASFKSASTTT
ncbi:MAG: hypothetical protein U0798_08875 [Gemmataceae bacterium]